MPGSPCVCDTLSCNLNTFNVLCRTVHVCGCHDIYLLSNKSFTGTYFVMVLVQISVTCFMRFPHFKQKGSNLGHAVMSCSFPETCFHVGDELGTATHFCLCQNRLIDLHLFPVTVYCIIFS
jgi:hypothetical protein